MILKQFIKSFFLRFYIFQKKYLLGKKIRNIKSLHKNFYWEKIDKSLLNKHKLLFNKLNVCVDKRWIEVYSNISGIKDYRYIPEDIYYTYIEPCLNIRIHSKSYTDKNFYHRLLPEKELPRFFIKSINGIIYNENYEKISLSDAKKILYQQNEFIIKPAIDSGGGSNVKLIKCADNRFYDVEANREMDLVNIFHSASENFICQERIINHPYYYQFNSTSLNTIRMLAYRSPITENVDILHTVLRVGQSGRVVDNQAAGGYALGVDINGYLTGFAVNKKGNKFDQVNGVKIKVEKIFLFEKLKEFAIFVASKFYYARLLGLDLCVNSNGEVKLIEVNCSNNEINFFQFTNGPLFGNYTEEVINYCAKHNRLFTFEITLKP